MDKENKTQNKRKAKRKANWKVRVKAACEKRGIRNANELWERILEESGGSKETAYKLWDGRQTMIQLETLNKLYDEFGVEPHEIFINESEDFNEPKSEVKEIEEAEKTKEENISTEQRFVLCELFVEVTKNKILNETEAIEFSEKEKKAFREIVKIIEPMMKGWKNSGRPRDENPSKEAKYLREYRAKRKTANNQMIIE